MAQMNDVIDIDRLFLSTSNHAQTCMHIIMFWYTYLLVFLQYIYVWMYTPTHTCVHIQSHMHMCECAHTCMHACTHMRMYTHAHTCMHTCSRTHMQTLCVCVFVCVAMGRQVESKACQTITPLKFLIEARCFCALQRGGID